eukprot:1160215-Pelagomonas_calceolata.AAC.2
MQESISQAKARMQMQAENDLQAGLQRVRQAQLQSTNSIEEARQRIQEQDRQVLALVQQIMARYRRGDYVPEVSMLRLVRIRRQRGRISLVPCMLHGVD